MPREEVPEAFVRLEQAAPRRRQVRRVRRDRHRQPGEERHPRGEIHELAGRRDRLPEPGVLTRGNTLRHKVLLLGGPNTYLPFLQQCWRLRIPETWDERGYDFPKDRADRGADLRPEEQPVLRRLRRGPVRHARAGQRRAFRGIDPLKEFINHGRKAKLGESAGPGLVDEDAQRTTFVEKYQIPPYEDPPSSRPARSTAA
jgi:hypothetical protein